MTTSGAVLEREDGTMTTSTPVDNGVNVEALLGAREALTQAPEAAKFRWRATWEWQNGTHSRSVVGGFFGLGLGFLRFDIFV